AEEGGGHVHWWVSSATAEHDALAKNLGLKFGRTLLQMQVSLPLPENLPGEFGEVNRRFNHMRKALEQLEDDRRVALAGISHDIRTPLTRLRMEVELASISQDVRANLVDDIERIDGVVRQFIDYARASVLQGSDTDDAAPGVKAAVERWRDDGLRKEATSQATDCSGVGPRRWFMTNQAPSKLVTSKPAISRKVRPNKLLVIMS
ncbi:MAG: hypothetical protein EBW71_00650, partial [Betaproteobacteria bacterium]|nr:hypothetical protein [Betaproteobacteria bacterium]